jgi:hypothetical protein
VDTKRIPDLKIEVPIEDWAKHADHSNDLGGEAAVMQKLRRALAEVWIREKL